MRHQGYVFIFFGLFASFNAATERSKRQSNSPGIASACAEVFNSTCPEIARIKNSSQGVPCDCVYYKRCPREGAPEPMLGWGPGIPPPPTCPGKVDVCCRKSFIRPPIPGEIPAVIVGPGATPSSPGPSLRTRPKCGGRNVAAITSRFQLKDNETAFGEFPWMVAVFRRPVDSSKPNKYIGGGSLIHPRAVLTAAHIVQGSSSANLIVRAGEWDMRTVSEPTLHQDRDVESIISHEDYFAPHLLNDFAILILRSDVELSRDVNVICLPKATDTFDGENCTSTGWGRDDTQTIGVSPSILKRVDLPVVSHAHCQTALRLAPQLGTSFTLDQSFMCAGGILGRDACMGDGGSPLTCPLKNFSDQYVQAGIVSWGVGCGQDQTPGVYGSVVKARSWIDSKLALNNITIDSTNVG